MALLHELPRKVLEYRELAKLKSTYVDALPRLIDPGTGRLHTRLSQTGAATGRLSSSDPNLQNIPVRTRTGPRRFAPRSSPILAGRCSPPTTRRSNCASSRIFPKTPC